MRTHQNHRSEALRRRFKDRDALHMMRHRKHVRIRQLEKAAGKRAFPGHRNGLPRAGASHERHGRSPLTPSFTPPRPPRLPSAIDVLRSRPPRSAVCLPPEYRVPNRARSPPTTAGAGVHCRPPRTSSRKSCSALKVLRRDSLVRYRTCKSETMARRAMLCSCSIRDRAPSSSRDQHAGPFSVPACFPASRPPDPHRPLAGLRPRRARSPSTALVGMVGQAQARTVR
jgi:hypothetical protein